jgi:glycosyltransferase involved in cell wall biosynthesis
VELSIYTPLNRLAIRSGVPRHLIEVVTGLLRDSSLQVSFFVNNDEAQRYLPLQGRQWTETPRVTFAQPVSRVARCWGIFNRPTFESMGGSAEWLYLPADGYVPVKRAKLAITIHDLYKMERPANGERRWGHYAARLRHWTIYKRAAASAARILTVSQFSADRIMHFLGIPASRIRVVYNGVSPDFYNPKPALWPEVRDMLQMPDGEPYFVYVGGLKAKKNGHGIIAAWREFESRRNDGQLIILGRHDEPLCALAKAQLHRVIFPPLLTDEQMAAMLASSAGLFFPSFYEGFGIPVVEAMAAGAPTVLSDIPPLRELAKDLAIYVDPTDPNSMADGLERCLASAPEARQRIEAGRRLAGRYTWDQVIRNVRESFE